MRRRRRRRGRSSRRGSGRTWRRSPRSGARSTNSGRRSSASKAQAQAAERQLASWTEERALNQKLVEKGATPRQKLLEFDRTIASLEGQRDAQRGLAQAATEDIARAETDIETLEQQRLVEIGQGLAEARRQVEALSSQIVAARDVVARSELRAPQAGVVVHVYIVTPGAVVPSGQPVMDIVPDGDPLVVETRLPPEAIDSVHVGRKAQVRLTAYRRSDAPVLDGEVTYVSADLFDGYAGRLSLFRRAGEPRPGGAEGPAGRDAELGDAGGGGDPDRGAEGGGLFRGADHAAVREGDAGGVMWWFAAIPRMHNSCTTHARRICMQVDGSLRRWRSPSGKACGPSFADREADRPWAEAQSF